jgi:hypothetical protein
LKSRRRKDVRNRFQKRFLTPLFTLRWVDVKREIESALGDLANGRVLVYEPVGKPPASKMTTATKKPNMTPGRAGEQVE